MQYTCVETIEAPRDRVVALFDDPNNLKAWQEGLVSFTHVSGEPGTPGATSEIVYQMGKRRLEMVETIELRDLPGRFVAVYEAKGVWNRNENVFDDDNGATVWTINSEFRCSGFLKVLAWLTPSMFSKQTRKMMRDFRTFVESA